MSNSDPKSQKPTVKIELTSSPIKVSPANNRSHDVIVDNKKISQSKAPQSTKPASVLTNGSSNSPSKPSTPKKIVHTTYYQLDTLTRFEKELMFNSPRYFKEVNTAKKTPVLASSAPTLTPPKVIKKEQFSVQEKVLSVIKPKEPIKVTPKNNPQPQTSPPPPVKEEKNTQTIKPKETNKSDGVINSALSSSRSSSVSSSSTNLSSLSDQPLSDFETKQQHEHTHKKRKHKKQKHHKPKKLKHRHKDKHHRSPKHSRKEEHNSSTNTKTTVDLDELITKNDYSNADKQEATLCINEQEFDLFESLITREIDPNGGGSVLIACQTQIDAKLTEPEQMRKFAIYFVSQVYSESPAATKDEEINETSSLKENEMCEQKQTKKASLNNCRDMVANYALGVVRNSAKHMPDLIDYFAEKHPHMTVKTSLLLNPKEINTLKISEYQKHVQSTYMNGTFRYGPLLQTSIVGIRNEEIGDYFPEFIKDYLESNPFLNLVMPWSYFSVLENMNPMHSNDGPIIWARPGNC